MNKKEQEGIKWKDEEVGLKVTKNKCYIIFLWNSLIQGFMGPEVQGG